MKILSSYLLLICFVIIAIFSVNAQSDPEVERLAALGVKAYEADNYTDAEKLFLQAIALEEQKQIPPIRRSSTSYVYLSDIYARVKKNRAKGDETIQKFLSFDKSWAQVYRTYAITISDADKTDQTEIDYLTEAVLLEPNNPENYYRRALALAHFPARAITDLTRAIKADPKFALAFQERGIIHLKLGDYAEAAADYEKYYQLDPKGGEIYFLRHGMALLFNGDINGAIGDFTKLINGSDFSHRGRRASAYYYRGYANLLNRNRAAAQADMIEAVKLDPAMKLYWYTRLAMEPDEKCRSEKKTNDDVEDLYKDKRYSAANSDEFRYQLFKLRAYQAICEPNSPSAVFKLIYRNPTDDVNIDYSHLQKYMRVLAPTEAQRDPNLPELLRSMNGRLNLDSNGDSKSIALRDETANIGTTANHLDRIAVAQKAITERNYHLAIALLNYVLEIEPGNISAQEERMRAFLFKGAHGRAYEEAQKLLKANPRNFVALNVRGLVNEMAMRNNSALADFTAAIVANPKYDKAYFNRGRFYLDQKKPDLALKDFDSALRYTNENWSYLTYRGHAHYALKDYKSATRDYAIVILSDKYNYEARVGLINALDRDGTGENKKTADEHHAWLIKTVPDYAGLKTIAGRNSALESNVSLAGAREKAVRDLVYQSGQMTTPYEVYKKNYSRYEDVNLTKQRAIDWLKQDLGTFDYIIKQSEILESQAKRVLADSALKLTPADISMVKEYIENAVRVRGFCRNHIAEAKESLSKLGVR